MISIPAGIFQMGASDSDRFANDTERPAHEVQVNSFALGKQPVTVAQYRCYQPGHAPLDDANWPVVNVSWLDAQGYCSWLGTETRHPYRLPTEAEWEYACRAGTTGSFAHGNELNDGQANYLFDEEGQRVGRGERTTVGSYPPNAFGLHDMHGNVCEWVADAWCATYTETTHHAERVIRGGAWDYMPRLLRSSWRDRLCPSTSRDNVGFRVATSHLDASDDNPNT
jgi:formylglycine-generating enzyme required for sulfatase activity